MYTLFIYLALSAFASQALAQIDFLSSDNLRESCRFKMAGRYLTIHDESARMGQFVKYLTKKRSDLRTEKQKVMAKKKQIDDSLKDFYFDPHILHQQEIYDSRLKRLDWALQLNQELLKTTKEKYTTFEKQRVRLKKKMVKVFDFAKVSSDPLGYQFHIDFKQKCSKYRFSCPLSRKYATLMRQIYSQKHLPVSCQRYSDYLR